MAKKFLSSLTAMLCCCSMFFGSACNFMGGQSSSSSSSSSNIEDSSTGGSSDETSGDNPNNPSENPECNVAELVDFVVDIPEGRDPVVLMLSDPQFIDAAQQRTDDRLGGLTDRYSRANIEDRVLRYIREAVTRSNPDLILVAGDVIYGEFDDSGYALKLFVDFMESFNIPWAPIMGNHECESEMGIDWICNQYEKAENCLFKQGTMTGNGNYTVGITQGGKLLRTFFMMDSNGYGHMSTATASNGHSVSYAGFGQDQINWYQRQIAGIKEKSPQTKLSFVFHIPIKSFVDALEENGFNNVSGGVIDFDADDNADTIGIANEKIGYPWDTNYTVWNNLKELGVDSIFSAHVHGNSMGAKYQGVHLQFGLKTGTYDALNYRTSSGGVNFGYADGGDPVTGGTVIPISKVDGSIAPYHIETQIEEDQVYVEQLATLEKDSTVKTVHIQKVVAHADSNKTMLCLQFVDEKGETQLVEVDAGVSSVNHTALNNFAKQIHFNNEDVFAGKGVIAGRNDTCMQFSLNEGADWNRSSYIYIPQETTYECDTDGNNKVDTIWTFDRDFKIVYDPATCVVRENLGGCNGDCDANEWHIYAKPLVGKEFVAVSCGYWSVISNSTKIGMAFYAATGEPVINLGYTGWVNPDEDTTAFMKYIKINGNELPSTARLQGFDQANGLQLSGLSLVVGDVVTVEKGAEFTHNGYTMTLGVTLSWTYNGGSSFTCGVVN